MLRSFPGTSVALRERFSPCFQGKQRVLVEGVRIIKKHLRKSQDNPSGKIAEREGPIHISNVRLLEREKTAKDEKSKRGKQQERPEHSESTSK